MGIGRENSEGCPVCGHPSGDCLGLSEPPIHIIGASLFPSLGHEDIFIVEEDVWVDERVAADITTKVRVAKAGDAIPMSRAALLNLL